MCEARYTKNLEVFKNMKSGNFNPVLLREYSGWGGLREAIYTPAIYRELKSYLTDIEILSIKKTMRNAYYTPKAIVDFIYGWLQKHGFSGGEILEPAIGNGVFIEHMPMAIRQNSNITAIELDLVTGKIVQVLYPDVTLHVCGFEEFNKSQKYDLIIGNPPYGANTVNDTLHSDICKQCIHHYFAAKCMRLLKSGGILAMVLPSYFLDNIRDHVRDVINDEDGGLIAAYRLPDDLFANAKVTVDIVFLAKGHTGNSWTNVQMVTIDNRRMPFNEYFFSHKENIFGKLAVVDMYDRKGLTCIRGKRSPYERMTQALAVL